MLLKREERRDVAQWNEIESEGKESVNGNEENDHERIVADRYRAERNHRR